MDDQTFRRRSLGPSFYHCFIVTSLIAVLFPHIIEVKDLVPHTVLVKYADDSSALSTVDFQLLRTTLALLRAESIHQSRFLQFIYVPALKTGFSIVGKKHHDVCLIHKLEINNFAFMLHSCMR